MTKRILLTVLILLVASTCGFSQVKISPISDPVKVVTRGDYKIEVVQSVDMPNGKGKTIYARAWDKISNEQYAFGPTKDVDVERINAYGLGTLVPDPAGTILRPTMDATGKAIMGRYRNDPVEAVLREVEHVLKVKREKQLGAVVPGKVGNTTSTFRSVPTAADPVDGYTARSSVTDSFATIRAGAGNDSLSTGTGIYVRLSAGVSSDVYTELRRMLMVFDTSAISSGDTISSATLSLMVAAKGNALGSPTYNILAGTTASNSAIASGDYANNTTTTSFASKAYADVNVAGTFNDFSLDANGIANINKGTSARSKFAARIGWDADNSTTGLTWANLGESGFNTYLADDATGDGTANDPKLVVEHAAGASIPSIFIQLTNQ